MLNLNKYMGCYKKQFIFLLVLYFFWGFITVLNDIFISKFKSYFNLNYSQALLIQFAFFASYFFTSIPISIFIKKNGCKSGLVLGLLFSCLGCFLFDFSYYFDSYLLLLSAFFILACGIAAMQVCANPYVSSLGDSKHSSGRLTVAASFNSIGAALAPIFGSLFLAISWFSSDFNSMRYLYLIIGVAIFLLIIVVKNIDFPEIYTNKFNKDLISGFHLSKIPHLYFGVLAIFFYVGAEVSIGSLIISYIEEYCANYINPQSANLMLFYYWFGALLGRFLGIFLLRFFADKNLLFFNCAASFALLLCSIYDESYQAIYWIVAIGVFNSIIFPVVFSLSIKNLGKYSCRGSGFLCMAIVGGAIIPVIQGFVADISSLKISFLVPSFCYLYIAVYSFSSSRLNLRWQHSCGLLK